MEVNHKSNKVLIKGKLLECPRGQSVLSHESWAKRFGKKWNRQKVIRFFKLLESDSMIEHLNEQVTTRISVCNYSQYQDFGKVERTPKRTGDDTPSEHQANTKRTGDDTQPNNDNNENNEKKEAKVPPATRFVKPSFSEAVVFAEKSKLNVDCQSFIDYYDSNGWKVGGKAPMKNWKAAMRQWAKRNFENTSNQSQGGIKW